MPKLTKSVPQYRKHRASGQAIVTIDGTDNYLGPHRSAASLIEYDRIIKEWLANGRRAAVVPGQGLTIAVLIRSYREHVKTRYVKNGRPTSEQHDIASAMKFVRILYANTMVDDFGPLALKAVRMKMIEAGWSRLTVNRQIQRVCRLFRWAVENELCPVSVYQRLKAVDGLRKGTSEARETAPIGPVTESVVQATLPHLSSVVHDMVRFQRLTGCRPGEVCIMRPCDVDTSGDVWQYTPCEHKTEHHSRQRIIFVGPQTQDILRPYLLRDKEAYCFSPADSERRRREAMHEARKTPLNYGNRPGTNKSRKPKRPAGAKYTTDAYRRAIERAVEKENAERVKNVKPGDEVELLEYWAPNRLRHSAATEIRKRFGIEGAQVVLGHAGVDVTQLYAAQDLAKAAAIMKEVG